MDSRRLALISSKIITAANYFETDFISANMVGMKQELDEIERLVNAARELLQEDSNVPSV